MVGPLGPLAAATREVKARAETILNCILVALFCNAEFWELFE